MQCFLSISRYYFYDDGQINYKNIVLLFALCSVHTALYSENKTNSWNKKELTFSVNFITLVEMNDMILLFL